MLPEFSKANLGRTLVCLGLVFPTLVSVHQAPQTVFWSECLAALFLAVAGGLIWFDDRDSSDGLPFATAGMSVVLICLAALSLVTRNGTLAGWTAYLSVLALAHCLAARADLPLILPVVIGFVCCGLCQSLVAFAQLLGLELGGLVMPKLYRLAFGNISQANHYADLIWLGLGGLLYLFQKRRVPMPVFAGSAIWLTLAAAASASRGVWLYTAAFGVLALWSRWRGGAETRRAFLGGLLIVVASVGAQMAVSYGHILDVFDVTSSLDRVADASSNGQRLHDWHVAWEAIKAHPWTGSGAGSFYSLTVEAAVAGPEKPFPMLAEHAHNLPLHLAAELGVPIALLICGGFAWWFLRQLTRPLTAERLFALCGLSVIGLHSMVEYPLWYTYFIIPAGLFLGLADADDPGVRRVSVPRWLALTVVAAGFAVLAWVMHDWLIVRSSYVAWNEQGRNTSEERRGAIARDLARVSRYSLFADEARNQELMIMLPTRESAPAIAKSCDARWTRKPDWTVMINCAVAYAATGQEASLDRVLLTLCRGFPKHHALLRDWIRESPDLGGLKIEGRACLM